MFAAQAKTIMDYQTTIISYLFFVCVLALYYHQLSLWATPPQLREYLLEKYLWLCGAVSALRASARQPRRLPTYTLKQYFFNLNQFFDLNNGNKENKGAPLGTKILMVAKGLFFSVQEGLV